MKGEPGIAKSVKGTEHGRAARRRFRSASKSDLLRVAEVSTAKAIHYQNTVILSRRAGLLLWLLGVAVGVLAERILGQ